MKFLETFGTVLAIIGLAVLLLALIVLMPLALIWAINTLFGLGIPYAPNTWLAAFLMLIFFRVPGK